MGKTPYRLTPLGDVLASVLKDRGLTAGLTLSGLQTAWDEAVGPSIAAHARPEALKGGTLTIIVDSSAWMNQLSMMRLDIIEKVRKAAGGGVEAVMDIRFRLGQPVAPVPVRKEPPFVPKKRALGPEDKAEVEDAVGAIPDPDLKGSVRRVLLKAKARVR